MRIAAASGKGGAGKTTVATNLALVASANGRTVGYLDCDVEEPDGALSLKPEVAETRPVHVGIPKVDLDKCNGCGQCGKICQYSAIVLLVAEPTPFGLNDLTLAVDMVCALAFPFGVVINRAGSGDNRTERYCRGQRIDALAEIPDDRQVAEAYSRGQMAREAIPKYRGLYGKSLNQIDTGITPRVG